MKFAKHNLLLIFANYLDEFSVDEIAKIVAIAKNIITTEFPDQHAESIRTIVNVKLEITDRKVFENKTSRYKRRRYLLS